MKYSQKELFLNSEGDQWHLRNNLQERERERKKAERSYLWEILYAQLNVLPLPAGKQNILEIGCSEGSRLNAIYQATGAECFGIDPSQKAIATGTKKYPALHLQLGTADSLPFSDAMFHVVIFGFCLYLCDRKDLFLIAKEADRVLKSGGYIMIIDFYSHFCYKNTYSHCKGMYSYKTDYTKMFLWHPGYCLVETRAATHTSGTFSLEPDERLALHILYKDVNSYQPLDPYAG